MIESTCMVSLNGCRVGNASVTDCKYFFRRCEARAGAVGGVSCEDMNGFVLRGGRQDGPFDRNKETDKRESDEGTGANT